VGEQRVIQIKKHHPRTGHVGHPGLGE
jgi:hypothetical protein